MTITYKKNGETITQEVDELEISEDLYVPKGRESEFADIDNLMITENGRYYPSGAGYKTVEADIEFDFPDLEVTQNGVYRGRFASVDVDCPSGTELAVIESTEINRNGIWKPRAGVTGWDSVYVNVVTGYEFSESQLSGYTQDTSARYVKFGGQIHLLGGAQTPRRHLIKQGDQWVAGAELPFDFADGGALAFIDQTYSEHYEVILIFGSSVSGNGKKVAMFYNGAWRNCWDLPLELSHFAFAEDDRGIYIVGGVTGDGEPSYLSFYGFKKGLQHIVGGGWKQSAKIGKPIIDKIAVVYDYKVNVFTDKSRLFVPLFGIGQQTQFGEEACDIEPYAAFACDDGISDKLHIIRGQRHMSYNGIWWKDEPTLEYGVTARADTIREDDEFLILPEISLTLNKEYGE